MSTSFKILVFTIIILEGDSKRPNIKDGTMPEKRDYRPSKWVANSAMDIWYGNKSMIDILSREFSDIMYKLTARPARSALRYRLPNFIRPKNITRKPEVTKEEITKKEPINAVSRVEINFINTANKTVHTITLQSMKENRNSTVFRVLEPLLGGIPEYWEN